MLDIDKHKNILLRILKDIYTDDKLASVLGFKGGTAAYLFYNLERFSVDLDFDLLDREKESEVFDKIVSIIEKHGAVKSKDRKRFSLFFLASYDEELTNIKIEINLRDFGSEYEVRQYLGIPIKVMVRKDMFAHKLVAMYERIGEANRDIFDVWFFLKNDWPINEEIVENRTDLDFSAFLDKCVEKLEEIPERRILSGMGELLSEPQKDWVRNNLKDEVIFNLKMRLSNALD